MLHIIANRYTLTEYLLDSLTPEQRAHAVHMHPQRIKGFVYSLLKALDAWLPSRLPGFMPFPADYLSRLAAIPHDTHVLIFGIENIKDLRILRKHLPTRRIALFTWNPVTDYQQHHGLRRVHLWQLKRLGFRMFTFDPADAAAYGITLIPQVYRRVDTAPRATPPQWDIYFLGKDKGRFATLRALGETWRAEGLRVRLCMTREHGSHYPATPAIELMDDSLGYQDNIDALQRARCVLEIVQARQTGPTIRCMEALFFDKKLITNNVAVVHQPFYDPDRIYVLGHDTAERFPVFMACQSAAVAPKVLDAHDFAHWIRQFA